MEEGLVTDSGVCNFSEKAVALRGVSVHAREGAFAKEILSAIDLNVSPGQFVAIIGPSGCGKSTLLRAISGLQPVQNGVIYLAGHPVHSLRSEFPLAIGYLGQFGAFHSELTVRESLQSAVALRLPRSVPANVKHDWLKHITQLAGIDTLLNQSYQTLSGGQMRRVALAEELIGDPAFLFLDELTSGLDEYSDQELMLWLRDLAHEHGKTILLVTHATYHLHLCDSVVFLHSGRLIQHGPLGELFSYLQVSSTAELLGLYRDEGERRAPDVPLAINQPIEEREIEPQPLKTARPPAGFAQFPSLFKRQLTLFFRDSGQLWIQLLLILIFPALVAVFATTGLPQVRSLTLSVETNILQTMQEQLLYLQESFRAASLLSGLAMFQVVLLTLMGANNSAREIAKEGRILDKELRPGLSASAYVSSKFLQITFISILQAAWMTWFVKAICGFPGSFFSQFAILVSTTLAMSSICLAISAASATPERASLLSIYLVGFQMPLSGAALSLPSWLSSSCQPFIAAYWGWSGYLKTFEATRNYDIVKQYTKTEIASYGLSIGMLFIQIVVGFLLAIYFIKRRSARTIFG